MPKIITFLLASLFFSTFAFVASLKVMAEVTDFKPTFSDIDQAHPQFTEIEYLAGRNIFQGHPDGTFRDGEINRAELMVSMTRLLGLDPDPEVYKDCFPDVKGWPEAAICYAVEQGWVEGYAEDGTFRPEQAVSHAERYKIILYTLFKQQIDAQTDDELKPWKERFDNGDEANWFVPYVAFAERKDLDRTHATQFYFLASTSSRDEVAQMIFRAILLKENDLDFYHPYLKDQILAKEGLSHLVQDPDRCYPFDSLRFDFYSNYLETEYGVIDLGEANSDAFYNSFSETEGLHLVDFGEFCPLDNGGFLFNTSMVGEGEIRQHFIRFDQKENMISDQEVACSLIELITGYGPVIFNEADLETFVPLSCMYSADANQVYADGRPLEGADVSSFQALQFPFAKDSKNVYEFDYIFEEADVNTFEPLATENLPFNIALYSKDANNVYFVEGGIVEYADPETFETVPLPVIKEPTNLEEFEAWFGYMEDMIFAKDDRHVFQGDQIMIELNPEHFRILGPYFLADSDTVYNNFSPMQTQELDPKTAEIVNEEDGSFYFKDANDYVCLFFGDGGESFYCGAMKRYLETDWITYRNPDQHLAFDWPREWGPVKEERFGIVFYGSPQSALSTGSDEMMSRQIFIALNDPTAELPDMGGYWGFEGRSLTSQEVVDSYCEDKENCEIIENNNGVRMAKYDFAITEWGENPEGVVTSQYYLYNPKSEQSGMVISPFRIKNRDGIENFDELFEAFVDSIEFID